MPTYTLELKLHTKRESDLRYLENYFREVARISNTVRRFAIRQLELLSRDPAYKTLLAEYRQLADRILCLQTYALFQQLHDTCILALKTCNRKLPSSFGIQ